MNERKERVEFYKEMARNDYYHGENVKKIIKDTGKYLKNSERAYTIVRVKELLSEIGFPLTLFLAAVSIAAKDIPSLIATGALFALDLIAIRKTSKKLDKIRKQIEFAEDFKKGYEEFEEEKAWLD